MENTGAWEPSCHTPSMQWPSLNIRNANVSTACYAISAMGGRRTSPGIAYGSSGTGKVWRMLIKSSFRRAFRSGSHPKSAE